jgi:hypothetical protein
MKATEMDAASADPSFPDPHAAYRQRLAEYRDRLMRLDARLAWVGNLRFALFALGIVLLGLSLGRVLSPWWLVPAGVAFAVLSQQFEKAARRSRHARYAIAFYEQGLARLEDRWIGHGIPGTEYLDENHLFAADLDLFGKGSLFERLCTAHTHVGRETLARWLSAPAGAQEVGARQAAVRALRDQPAWREQLVLIGADVPEGIDTAGLTAWGAAGAAPAGAWAFWAAHAAVAATWLLLVAWSLGWVPLWVPLAALLAQTVLALVLGPRTRRALAGLHGRSRDLFRLSGLLTAVERESFTAPRLRELQAALQTQGETPSRRLAELARLIEQLDSTHNQLFGILAPFLLWTTRLALAVETWRRRTGPALPRWLAVIGEVEALAALAGYAYENPAYPFPEVVADGPLFEATGLGHPLLPRAGCVVNDVSLTERLRLLVVSGSNMSGKSTFLRTIGANAVLALAGAPVRAQTLRLSSLALGATLRIQDSLLAGRSRFYAEITRLRQIVDRTREPLPVLFLLDEILHGTNSHDRRIGAEAVVRTLLARRTIGLVTTHDLALAELAQRLAPAAANVHFADHLVDGKLEFDYRLRPGVVQHSNALALMRAVGLDVEADAPQA